MPYEEQNEWPSFETVLRDVAPDSPTVRALATASRRAQMAADAESTTASAVADIVTEEATDRDTVILLPEPLEPLEIDTSSIRELLEPKAATEHLLEIADSALSEVAPAEAFDIADIKSAPIDVDEAVINEEPGVLVYEMDEHQIEMIDTPIEAAPDTPFAKSLDDDSPFLTSAFDGVAIDFSDVVADQPIEHTAADVLETDPPADNVALEGLVGTEELVAAEEAVPADQAVAAEELVAAEEPIPVEELEVVELGSISPHVDADIPGIELPDELGGAVEVFDDLGPSFDEFDVVATADQIETDLGELVELGELDDDLSADDEDDVDPDNVIPLHRDQTAAEHIESDDERDEVGVAMSGIELEDLYALDNTDFDAKADDDLEIAPEPATEHAIAGVREDDVSFRTSQTDWVSLAPDATTKDPDPWEHMRPNEEATKTGFWANRPKFFGGDERKRKKAERRASQTSEPELAVDVTFDKACPNCGAECRVDLDDPIGRRVHVSCPACQHMWHTPYQLEHREAG